MHICTILYPIVKTSFWTQVVELVVSGAGDLPRKDLDGLKLCVGFLSLPRKMLDSSGRTPLAVVQNLRPAQLGILDLQITLGIRHLHPDLEHPSSWNQGVLVT